MNTPAHAVLNLLVLGRKRRPELLLPIAVGAVLPDLPMLVFYAWEKLVLRTPEGVIWSERYHDLAWQSLFDLFNSLPLVGLGLLLAWLVGAPRAAALLASMALHSLADLPLHNSDAHRHFWPMSDWRFVSPVSYWNPDHGGQWVGLAEGVLVLVGSAWLWRRFESRRARWLIGVVAGVYVVYLGYVAVVWA